MFDQSNLADHIHKQRLSRMDTLLLIMAVDAKTPKMVKTIKTLGREAGSPEVQKWNVSDILKRSKGLALNLPGGWCLSSRGREHIQALGVLPKTKNVKIVNQAQQLRTEASKISDDDTKAFVSEAISAYEAGLYRSCVVLSWIGAISLLYDHVMSTDLATFNAEAKKRDAKWKVAKIKDDLGRMKESDFLDIIGSPPISIIGKNLKEELKNNCLKLRNACGHPSSLQIGENKASAHIEILILNIFNNFS